MKEPKFDIYVIADVSTRHITRKDAELIGCQTAPGHIASIDPPDTQDGSPGDVFAVFLDADLHGEQIVDLQAFGFSASFVAIFQSLFRQRIPYVRFDAEGADVDGLPSYSW